MSQFFLGLNQAAKKKMYPPLESYSRLTVSAGFMITMIHTYNLDLIPTSTGTDSLSESIAESIVKLPADHIFLTGLKQIFELDIFKFWTTVGTKYDYCRM